MNPNYTHDFSSASIKHQIEAELYQIVGNNLGCNKSTTIVTGPDYKRHIDNYRKYVNNSTNLRICEINTDIFIDIYQGCKNIPNVTVVNKSVELFGSSFIDCDLTCISDITVIENTLLKQVSTLKGCAIKNKAFIYTYSLRSNINTRSLTSLNNSVIIISSAPLTGTVTLASRSIRILPVSSSLINAK